jgi:outer membrane protein TolC
MTRLQRSSLWLAVFLCVACSLRASGQSRTFGNEIGPPTNRAALASPATVSNGPAVPLELTVERAILLGLENNRALKVERLNPDIRRTVEEQERAVFDPALKGSLARLDQESQDPSLLAAGITNTTTRTSSGGLSIEALLPTGTRLSLEGRTSLMDSSVLNEDFAATRAGVSVTQSLLRGGRPAANLASLRQARLDTLASQYELRGFAEALVARIEEAYWNCLLAERQIEIFAESLKLAQQQLSDLRERIRLGTMGEIELAAAEAEVASRQEGLINAQSELATRRLQLLRLVSPTGSALGRRDIVLRDPPAPPDPEPDDEEARVLLAHRMRPELNQARLNLQRGELEVVKTKNGLLPRLDLFVTLGRTGYADSFGASVSDISRDGHDTAFGLQFEYPLGNRDAESRRRRAELSREQAREALENLAQLVEFDVRAACVEVRRAREQVAATAATTKFRAEALRAETEKFQVGRSTTLSVAQTQRDLLQSRLLEMRAAVGYRNALAELYRLDGSLLERRGIAAPGAEPVAAGVGSGL